MSIRSVEELSDAEQARLFGWGDDVFGVNELDIPWRPKDGHVLIDVDGEPVCHVGYLKRERLKVGQVDVLVGGIGGVITVPEAQGRGYAHQVLREAERRIAEDSQVKFAMLFCLASLLGFYSHDGYVKVTGPVRYRALAACTSRRCRS